MTTATVMMTTAAKQGPKGNDRPTAGAAQQLTAEIELGNEGQMLGPRAKGVQ